MIAVLAGCQQNRSSTLSPTISNEAQLEQLSSVAAGARYLKNKCSRSDLPSDDAIDRAAWNVGKKRGWGNIDYATLSQRRHANVSATAAGQYAGNHKMQPV